MLKFSKENESLTKVKFCLEDIQVLLYSNNSTRLSCTLMQQWTSEEISLALV